MRPFPSHTRRPSVALVLVLLATAGPALADPVPEIQNGLPLLPIPTYEEVGLPPFTTPAGTPSTGQDTPAPPDRTASEAGSGDGTDSPAIAAMMARSWGEAAAQNAQMVGVTPVAVAATCVMESGCSSNPATQSIAAAEYLRQGAMALQATNLANPSVLDVRGYYNFGPAPAVNVARAADEAVMSDLVPLTAAQYRANGIVPGITTAGQWRATITSRIGPSAARASVLPSRS